MMKKEYETKKILVIVALAVTAVCIAGVLYLYLWERGMHREPDGNRVGMLAEQIRITVPEAVYPKEEKPGEVSDDQQQERPVSEKKSAGDNRPQTRKDAIEPDERPQLVDEAAVTDPDRKPQYIQDSVDPGISTETEPAGGTPNESGQIYVPGFGYVADPGIPSAESADSDGDWNQQVGEMN